MSLDNEPTELETDSSSGAPAPAPLAPATPEAPLRLAGATVQLVTPRSIAERWNIEINMHRPGVELTVLAAALGMCWPRLRGRVPYRHDVLAYGDAVIDYLMSPEQGANRVRKPTEIIAAGRRAYRVIIDGLVPVEGAQDFSEPPRST